MPCPWRPGNRPGPSPSRRESACAAQRQMLHAALARNTRGIARHEGEGMSGVPLVLRQMKGDPSHHPPQRMALLQPCPGALGIRRAVSTSCQGEGGGASSTSRRPCGVRIKSEGDSIRSGIASILRIRSAALQASFGGSGIGHLKRSSTACLLTGLPSPIQPSATSRWRSGQTGRSQHVAEAVAEWSKPIP